MLPALTAQLRTVVAAPLRRPALALALASTSSSSSPTTMPSAARSSSHSSAPPPGNPLAVDKYQAGKASAFAYLREHGFPEDSAVECAVAWGECVASFSSP